MVVGGHEGTGGLVVFLRGEAAEQGVELGRLVEVTAARVVSETVRGCFSVQRKADGELYVEVRIYGLDVAAGRVELSELVRALGEWHAGVPLGEIWVGPPLVRSLSDLHEAVPGRVVETAWRLTLERHPGIRLGDPEVAEAAYAEPRLRALFPHPTHGLLRFARNTRWPFVYAPVSIGAAPGMHGWRVYDGYYADVLDDHLTPREAAVVAAAGLPEDCGPAVEGSWPIT
jgi:hypothetical protein